MAHSKDSWTHPLALNLGRRSYEPVPTEPDHSPLLSSTERGGDITRPSPKNRTRIQRPPRLIIAVLVALTALLAVTVIVRHRFDHEQDSDLDPDDPVAAARLHVDALLARQSATYTHAAAKYSLKTGRAPPRNYDKWFTFAQAHSCLIDEYDQINRDFAPFYKLAADDPLFFRHRVDIVADVRLV